MAKEKQPTGVHEYEGKQYNVFHFVNTEFGFETDLFFVRKKYRNNNTLAIEVYETNDESFCTVTVNLCDPQQIRKNHAFFDVNNCGWMQKQLIAYGLMKQAENKYKKDSGFVTYPLCEWDINLFRVGGEKTKYYVDLLEHRDGHTFAEMIWSFQDKPETETEDIEQAKKTAEESIQYYPYNETDDSVGIIELYVEDENGNKLYSVVNVSEETAKAKGVRADKYIEVLFPD